MRRVLLLGSMGAGKTTVGEALAARTGWPHLDNDAVLRALTGRDARQLLAEGEPVLRAAESRALAHVLALPEPLVAGVAAGVVLDPADRARLRDGGHVVWLRAPVDVLARRVGTGTGRPWLGDDPGAALRALAAVRDPLFAEVAAQVVDVAQRTPAQVVDDVLAAVG